MKRNKKIKKIVIMIIAILIVILVGLPTKREVSCEGSIFKENHIREECETELFNSSANLGGTVNIYSGQATIQILNEADDVIWEKNFTEGTTIIDKEKINNFKNIRINIVTDDAEGDYSINITKLQFGFNKYKL